MSISQIDNNAYLAGKMLNQALFEFGNSELIEIYQASTKPIDLKNSPKGLFDLAQSAAQALILLQNNKSKREKMTSSLREDILEQIKRGDLIALGFKEPRNIQDNPVKIPADLFFIGEINWEKSELKSKTLEFSGIRLLKDLSPITDLKAEKIQPLEITEIKNNAEKPHKSEKSNFSDLSPDKYINEKDAAEFLGISVKTLQGLRSKGGGPEYSKLGPKMVRYQFGKLQKWVEERKKKNTSQD